MKDKTEIQRRFEEIMEKKLNNKFISSGDLIRFRDACVEFGKQEVRDVLETKLNYWNNLLKNKSNHSLSDEIDIQQMRAKVEIIEELLSKLDDVSLNNSHPEETSKEFLSSYEKPSGSNTKLGCGKDTEYYIGWDCNDNEIYLKCGEFSLTTGEIVYCPSCKRKKKETSNICICGHDEKEHRWFGYFPEARPNKRCKLCNCKKFQPIETKLSEDEE